MWEGRLAAKHLKVVTLGLKLPNLLGHCIHQLWLRVTGSFPSVNPLIEQRVSTFVEEQFGITVTDPGIFNHVMMLESG